MSESGEESQDDSEQFSLKSALANTPGCREVAGGKQHQILEVVATEVEVGMETKDSCHLQPLKEEQQHQKQLLDINAEPVKRGRGRPKGTKRKHKARYNYFVENKDDENEASTSTSSVCSFSTAQMDKPGFPSSTEEKTKEPSKERLVEFDKQWYKVIIFFWYNVSNFYPKVQWERLFLHPLQLQKQFLGQLESPREGGTQYQPFEVLNLAVDTREGLEPCYTL